MKVTCPRSVMAAAFATVSGVVPSRTPKPVLQNIKLQVAAGEAVLIGTDQEVGIRHKLSEADAASPGEVLLPNSRVSSILRELQGETVTIETTDEGTWIRGERAEYKLSSADPAEFPNVSEFDAENYYIISSDALRQLIKRTVFATDTESTRYALGGVLCDLGADAVTMVATDTRRLAVAKGVCTAHGSAKSENSAPVVPSKAMQLIERSLGAGNDQAWLAIRQNDVLIKTGATTIYARLVEGRFPRYQDVIPKESAIKIDLVAGAFHAAVRQAQIVTSEESRGVDFQVGPGLMTLKSSAAEVGQSKVEMPIAYEGNELTITFDPRYVADFLKVLPPEQAITLELQDSESAALFQTADGYQYIVMPLARDR